MLYDRNIDRRNGIDCLILPEERNSNEGNISMVTYIFCIGVFMVLVSVWLKFWWIMTSPG